MQWSRPALGPLRETAGPTGTGACRLQSWACLLPAFISCYAVVMQPGPPSARLSFPKTKRLTLPVEFGRVRSEGTAEGGRFLVLGVFARKDETRFRVGFVTSKRIGGAVVR